jgi:hypothetical protein
MESHFEFTVSTLHSKLSRAYSIATARISALPRGCPATQLQVEEAMNKQISVSLAALALGAALISVPAFAQKSANDGGSVAEPSGSTARQSAQQAPGAPHSGKSVNDGGLIDEPAAAPTGQRLYNSVQGPQQAAPTKVTGKSANDGGPM